MKNKLLLSVGIILGMLIITNPSVHDFKEYVGNNKGRRKYNLFLYSIYIDHYEYLAIAGNFFIIPNDPIIKIVTSNTPVSRENDICKDCISFSKPDTIKRAKKLTAVDKEIDKELNDFIKKTKKKGGQ